MVVIVCTIIILVTVALFVAMIQRPKVASGTRSGIARRPIQDILNNPDDITYNRVDFPLPSPQVGWTVRLTAMLQFSLLGRYILGPSSKAKTGLDIIQGEYIPEKPTFTISIPSPVKEQNGDNKEALEQLVQKWDSNSSKQATCMDFYRAYNEGRCTPVDIANTVLESIKASNKLLRAIVEYDEREVLRMAKESAKRWKSGKPLSYLDGVPISIKAQYSVHPYQCTAGCSFQPTCARNIPESVAVRRLKDAGAVIIGIANMQEAAAGTFGSNPNKQYGIARNPYNTAHYCGGSSSGSAASVAAGLCPLSMGSDDGGSIRIPAAMSGVYGLKPTFGLLNTTGFTPISHTVGVIGPLASSPVDIAVAMDIMCNATNGKNNQIDFGKMDKDGVEGLKIGVYWEYFEHADKEIVSACRSVLDKLTDLGAICESVKIAELLDMKVAHLATACVEFGSSLAVDVDKRFNDISAETLGLVGLGYSYSGTDYINAQKQRTRTILTLKHLFSQVDVLVTPMCPCVAPKVPTGAEKYGLLSNEFLDVSIRFTSLANFAGIPSIAVPIGLNSAGLPISLQIMGPWYGEGQLLHVAQVLEVQLACERKLPPIYYKLLEKYE